MRKKGKSTPRTTLFCICCASLTHAPFFFSTFHWTQKSTGSSYGAVLKPPRSPGSFRGPLITHNICTVEQSESIFSSSSPKASLPLLLLLLVHSCYLQICGYLLRSTRPRDLLPRTQVWNERDIDSMNERLKDLMTTMRSPHSSTTNMDTNQNNSPRPTNDNGGNSFIQPHSSASLSAENPMDMDVPLTFAEESFSGLPPGWRRLNEREGWRPAPIGVCVRAVPTN